MDYNGFVRVASAVPVIKPADPEYNADQIIHLLDKAVENGVGILVCPELCISGYTCGDLFLQSALIDKCLDAVLTVAGASEGLSILVCVGAPIRRPEGLYNCAVAICNGNILGVIPKSFIPNYGEYYEKRHFISGEGIHDEYVYVKDRKIPFGTDIMIDICGVRTCMEICEDLWAALPPSTFSALSGADIILNLSASNESTGKHEYLMNLISQQSARLMCCYAYSSAGCGESSTDLVFAGNALIYENGRLCAESERFKYDTMISVADIDIEYLRNRRMHNASWSDCAGLYARHYRVINAGVKFSMPANLLVSVDPLPFVPSESDRLSRCKEIISIQVSGLMQRLSSIGCRTVTVGISGGLDSTLALLVCVEAFDRLGLPRKNIYGITMPGFGTTQRTHNNSRILMECLGVTLREIPISSAVNQHFKDIGHDSAIHDVTYENSQARERTQILMDYANKTGGIVIGTGDLSELALGWCTYNGDHMSMYAVNSSIPKTLVKYLVETFAEEAEDPLLRKTLTDIVATPISPELIPASDDGEIVQKTEELVGPYVLHDFFLYHTLRNGFSPAKIFMLAKKAYAGTVSGEDIKSNMIKYYKRFFSQQFKRSCMPDGPKVGSVCLSPRGDWRMPSDVSPDLWINEIEKIES